MKHTLMLSAFALALTAAPLPAQAPTGNQAAPAGTDIYHVHFNKAAPGKAAVLGARLRTSDPTAPMPGHLLVLRHQEGDDWDYCVIEHLGAKATIDPAGGAVPADLRDQSAWHDDTFVAGPPWAEFARQMGLDNPAAAAGNPIYIVGVQRALPGHRDQLEQTLRSPAASKVPIGNVVLQHLEGGDWNFLTLTRYNSWTDLAADRTAATAATGTGSQWADVRMHSAAHRDTIADRMAVTRAAAQAR